MYTSLTILFATLTTLLTFTTARPAIAGLSGNLPANFSFCKKADYQDCVFGVTRNANDCITLPANYPLVSIKFESNVKCQIFTDKNCGADVTMRYVRLETENPDLTGHNEAIGGYFQSLMCAGGD